MKVCFYCGAAADTIDHLLPLSRGGSDDPVNLVDCCRHCNFSKGCQTPGEFATFRSGCRIDAVMSHSPRRRLVARIADYQGIPRGWAGHSQRATIRAALRGDADG